MKKIPLRFYIDSTGVIMPRGEFRRVQKNGHNNIAFWCFTPVGASKPIKVRGEVFYISGQKHPYFKFTHERHLREYLKTTPVNTTYEDISADAKAERRMIYSMQHSLTFA
jgi:hypothetical protein